MTAQYAIHELKQVRQYCSALLPFTGLIPPGGAAAWALLALSVPLLVAGEV